MIEVETSLSEIKDSMMTEAKMKGMMKDLVAEAAATATAAAYATKPQWASDIEKLLITAKDKADAAEESVEAIHIRLMELEKCTFSIGFAEKLAMRSTAHQTRIYNFDKNTIEKHIRDKLPAIKEMPTFEKDGSVTIASFKTKKEAATFAKSVKQDKLHHANKSIYCKPQLPPEVVASQAPLKRAVHAYNTIVCDDKDDNRAYIDYNTRTVKHGDKIVIEPFANGSFGPVAEHLSTENCDIINEAIYNRDYFKDLHDAKKGRDAREKPKLGDGKGGGKGASEDGKGPGLLDKDIEQKKRNNVDVDPSVKHLKSHDDTNSKPRGRGRPPKGSK